MSADHLTLETVGAFVDGELSPADQTAAQSHLQQCHACALRVLATHQLKTATKRAGQQIGPSSATLARLTAQARQTPPKRTPVVSIRSVSWISIAALVLLTVSLGMVRLSNQQAALSAELLDQHLAVLSDSATLQVISEDRHTVKPWFQGKLPFSFNLPEPNTLPQGTALQGANLAYVEGRPAALLLFSIHKHRASIFVTQTGALPDLAPHSTKSGFNVLRRKNAGLEFAAISDVAPSDLDALVRTLADAQR